MEIDCTDCRKNNHSARQSIVSREFFDVVVNKYLEKSRWAFRGRVAEQYILADDGFVNEFWAVGQHYQLKTPLLDWTKSLLVALFFAFSEVKVCLMDKYRVIYILDILRTFTNTKIIESRVDIGGRMNAQRGVFTDLLLTEFLEENKRIAEIGSAYPFLTRVRISTELRIQIMRYLEGVNIRVSTLFPDIDGAVKESHSILNKIIYDIEDVCQ